MARDIEGKEVINSSPEPQRQDTTVVASSGSSQVGFGRGRKIGFALAVIFLATALFLLAYYHNRSTEHSKTTPTGPYSYTYKPLNSQLDSFFLIGATKGSGLVFQKPSEFLPEAYTTSNPSLRTFSHNMQLKGQAPVVAGNMAAKETAVTPSSSILTLVSNDVQAFKKDTQSTAYKTAVAPVEQFAKTEFPPTYSIKLGHATAFKSDYIGGTAAWQFDLTAQASSVSQTLPQKGKVVYVLGKETIYYFMISTVDYNWRANSVFFQKILDSIKIDQ